MNLYECIQTHLYEPITAEMLCFYNY